MTIGIIAANHVQLLTTQSMNIQPSGSSTEWIIHNIIVPFGATCELYKTDGTNHIKVMNLSTSILNGEFHCSNDYYYFVKNNGSTTIYVGYDGLVMQE